MRCFKIFLFNMVLLILLSSCQMSSNNKIINVHIQDIFPYEEEICKPLWYRLSYNDSLGVIHTKKIARGIHDVTLCVPKNTNTYLIAQVVGDYYPQGGVITTSTMSKVNLTFEQGYLVDFLLSIENQNSDAVNVLNYEKLLQTLKDTKLLYNFDQFTLARAILNGTLVNSSIYSLNNVRVDVTQIPPGYWVSDYQSEGSFWVTNYTENNVILSLNDGIHNYLNYYNGFLCRVVVDARNNKYFVTLKPLPDDLE